MTFGHPYFLWALLLLPLIAWLKGRRGAPPTFLYSSLQLVAGLTRENRSRAGRWLAGLRWIALGLFLFALSQPRLTHSETKVTASGVDIVVALDMSGSMVSEDFELKGGRVNRFNMARAVLKQFIEQRPNDRIGLVVFATDAFISTPLTLDHDFLDQNLDRLQIGAIDENRTAIGSGLSTAINRLRELKSKSKIVILMTDGENNSGKIAPLAAAEAAKALGVKVYTIGVGMRGEAPMPAGRNPFTGEIVYRRVPVDIDEETLTKIAQMTNGKYYRADNTQRFQEIYAEIDKLEKTEVDVHKFAHHRELAAWLISPGLGLLLLEMLLRQTLLRRLP
jgi:Ca-activated chloride channel family protein